VHSTGEEAQRVLDSTLFVKTFKKGKCYSGFFGRASDDTKALKRLHATPKTKDRRLQHTSLSSEQRLSPRPELWAGKG